MTTVSINYDFTTCESDIPMRTSNYKFSCRVNKKLNFVVKQFLDPGRKSLFNSWNENFLQIFTYLLLHSFFSCKLGFLRFIFRKYKFIMLCTYNFCVDPERFIVVIIFNCNL